MPNFAWSSQGRGFFTDRAGRDKRDNEELVRVWYSEKNFGRRDRAIELAKKLGKSPIHVALAYVLAQPFPSVPLIGPRTLGELDDSLQGARHQAVGGGSGAGWTAGRRAVRPFTGQGARRRMRGSAGLSARCPAGHLSRKRRAAPHPAAATFSSVNGAPKRDVPLGRCPGRVRLSAASQTSETPPKSI